MTSELEDLSSRPTALRRIRQRRPSHRVHPSVLVAVGIGGALGTVCRYELALAAPVRDAAVPWMTVGINVGGSFVLGVLLTFVLERWPPTRYVRPFLAIGFLGAFTTFSAFTVELDTLVEDGHVGVALGYMVASMVGGLAAAYAGVVAGRAWPALRRRMR